MSSPLVFLHGWGQSKQTWHQQQTAFPDALFLNLPGHGGTAESSDWIETIADQLPTDPSIIIGWSLGGILAMQLALKHPEKVAGLALISTTPAFCQHEGWQHGCSRELFEAFENGVANNAPTTMSRFFMLMLQGDGLSRSDYNAIAKQSVNRTSPPSIAMLRKGLDYLAESDLRDELASIRQPALIIHGEEDAVVPVEAGIFLAEHLPQTKSYLINDCGHAPFLTQSALFNATLSQWRDTL
jgi:pimeloyl-[acyl-carrier protein] methyl ester esterase